MLTILFIRSSSSGAAGLAGRYGRACSALPRAPLAAVPRRVAGPARRSQATARRPPVQLAHRRRSCRPCHAAPGGGGVHWRRGGRCRGGGEAAAVTPQEQGKAEGGCSAPPAGHLHAHVLLVHVRGTVARLERPGDRAAVAATPASQAMPDAQHARLLALPLLRPLDCACTRRPPPPLPRRSPQVVADRGLQQGDLAIVDFAAKRADTGEELLGATRNSMRLDSDDANETFLPGGARAGAQRAWARACVSWLTGHGELMAHRSRRASRLPRLCSMEKCAAPQ